MQNFGVANLVDIDDLISQSANYRNNIIRVSVVKCWPYVLYHQGVPPFSALQVWQ